MARDKPAPGYVDYVRGLMQAVKQSREQSGALKGATQQVVTMKSVSKATGIEYTALSKFTSGQRGLSTERLAMIEEYLKGAQ